MKHERIIFDYMLIITFVSYLFIPLIFTSNQKNSFIENRKLASLPEWNWNKQAIMAFPQKFQTWFNDHFGFRNHLARMHYLLEIKLESSSNPSVLIGKNNWLFYKGRGSVEDYRKNDPLTIKQLTRWKNVLETRYKLLKKQGIYYIFVIAPDKKSIYGEYYPSHIRTVGTQTRMDQFMEYMKNSEVPILDLRSTLINAKTEAQVYEKTGTHWNTFGAAVAQYSIMHYIIKVNPNIQLNMQPIKYAANKFLWINREGFGLAKMLNLQDIIRENYPILKSPVFKCKKQIIGKELTSNKTFMITCSSKSSSILIFRDSFFESLEWYTSQYFSKSIYVWTYPNMEKIANMVKQHKTNMVIEQRVERNLTQIPYF